MPRLNDDDRAVISACFLEKGWRGAKICYEFRGRNWNVRTVNRCIKNIERENSAKRKQGSGRPVTATTHRHETETMEMILSQEDKPGTHKPPSKISRKIGVSVSSVKRMVKKSGVNNYKRLKSTSLTEGARQRRLERSKKLLTRFPMRRVKLMCFQDEKDFTLEVPTNVQNNRVYSRNRKSEIAEERLYHKGNRQSLKLMVSCCLSWNGVTSPFFVDPSKMKVTGSYYTKHLRTQLLPACEKLYPANDFIFQQDGASSHTSNVCQNYLRATLGRGRMVSKTEWPPKSPDLNVLDYYFWNKVKETVYEGRRTPFENVEQLKRRIKRVWWKAVDMEEVRRAISRFRPRIRCVIKNNAGPIKPYHG